MSYVFTSFKVGSLFDYLPFLAIPFEHDAFINPYNADSSHYTLEW